jgi:branched-chain amino acid transport system ATP-binding protein
MTKVLELKDIHFYYGEMYTLKGISLYIEEGEIIALIGANGAGKTTILRVISGLLGPIQRGSVEYMSKSISHIPPHKIAASGIVQVLEGKHIFPYLTVLENLMMGAYRRNSREAKEELKYIFNLFPCLKERKNQMGGTLSGGEQQMLALSRAIMSKPKIILMDEPSLGLAPLIVKEIFEIIKKINNSGIPILLVEQNSEAALRISKRAYVIDTGKIVMQGNSQDMLNNEEVKRAYFGY